MKSMRTSSSNSLSMHSLERLLSPQWNAEIDSEDIFEVLVGVDSVRNDSLEIRSFDEVVEHRRTLVRDDVDVVARVMIRRMPSGMCRIDVMAVGFEGVSKPEIDQFVEGAMLLDVIRHDKVEEVLAPPEPGDRGWILKATDLLLDCDLRINVHQRGVGVDSDDFDLARIHVDISLHVEW